jgi:hypothetical protein
MITRNKQTQQRGMIATALVVVGLGGVFLSQSISDSQQVALQSINALTKLSDQKQAVARIPLDYKSINVEAPPQEVESTSGEVMSMVKAMEGDWIRTNSLNNELFNGMRIHFRSSDDGSQVIGTITSLPQTASNSFSRGEIKYKGLRGSFHSGFFIQDKVSRGIEGDPFSEVDIQMSPEGKEIKISAGGDFLYSLTRITQ